ncbi:MAG TPA: YaiO family outer membrane beta-barrel protein [Woeseiaceae bacterium]|nr:YaiO family outer membrane beta-barrel protein [Woeseiaceae bacterium]
MPDASFSSSGDRYRFHWILPALAAGLFCVCSGAAAANCTAPGASTPAEHFQCARGLAQRGDYAAALHEYGKLSARYPENVDYLFGEAQVRFWSGDEEGALRLLLRARQLAPEYEAVWRLEHQILDSLDRPGSGPRREAFRSAALQQFPDAAWLKAESASVAARFGWEVGMNVDRLDNGAANWQHVYGRMDRRSPEGAMLFLTWSEHRRFDLTDSELGVGGSYRPADNWIVDGGVHLGPNAEFLPETTAELGVARVLQRGWIVGADLRQRRYPDDTVHTLGVDVQRYFGSFHASWQLQNTRLASASSFVQIASVAYFADSGSRYGITLAAGKEVEIAAPGRLVEMDINALAFSGSHPLNEQLDILWRVGTHKQGSFYRRNTIGVSIAGAF